MTKEEIWHYPIENNDYPKEGEKVIIEFHTGWMGEVVFENKHRWDDKKGNIYTAVKKWRHE